MLRLRRRVGGGGAAGRGWREEELKGALTGFVRRAVLREENIGEVVVVRGKTLLMQLQFTQSLALLVLDRPEVLQ